MLAVLALLCQSLALLAPLPAEAAPPLDFDGGYILCHGDADRTPGSTPNHKAPCPHCVDCPLCQVVFHGGNLVPPTPIVLPPPSEQAVLLEPEAAQRAPHLIAARAHRARGPPSIPSL
jgi:hypothetical protein